MKTKTYFIFIRIVIILICAYPAIKIENIIWEFLPHTNFYGDTNINTIPGLVGQSLDSLFGAKGTAHTYNQGDIFQRLYGLIIWANLILIITLIINLFKKDFMKNFLKPIEGNYYNINKEDYGPKKIIHLVDWLLMTIFFPIIASIFTFLIDTILYFVF